MSLYQMWGVARIYGMGTSQQRNSVTTNQHGLRIPSERSRINTRQSHIEGAGFEHPAELFESQPGWV